MNNGRNSMELRELTSAHERQIFAKCLAEARATRGVGFKETARSRLGNAHLMFGNLYALFEKEDDPAERMVGGFIVHDLATFPQSCPKPDLSHLPPRSVIEGGELWSLSKGVFRLARRLAPVIAGLMQAKAILLYPMLRPVDLTALHRELNFVDACEPVKWPWLETVDGSEIWAQPLILQGEKLEEYIRSGFELLFRAADDRWLIRFDASRVSQPRRAEVSMADSAGDHPERPTLPSNGHADHGTVNASAH
jgi:hypothetical protein